VSRLPSIGEALRSAREAQGKSVEDAAAATRIRSSYLEALEQEHFEQLGGNVYAKGFLRSYARFLGVDPDPLLDAYRAQERPDAPLFEHAPTAIRGGRASGRRGQTWLAVAIVCVSIILVVSLWSLLRPAPDPTNAQPPFAPEPATTAVAGAGTSAPPTTARPAPSGVTVTLRYRAPSWTRITADGKVFFEGTPGPDERRTFRAKRSIDLILGAPAAVSLTVNGKDLGVPDRSGAIWRHSFTPGEPSLG
jgi:transcriptional regulator with XRE-family HTH domain